MPVTTQSPEVVIVGGGVAGLSLAVALAPHARVVLLEREDLFASHASGNNAAIYRPLEDDETSAWLAGRSLELVDEWLGMQVLAPVGVLLVSSDPERVRTLHARAERLGVRTQAVDHLALTARAPVLAGGEARAGLLLQDGGVLDIHALTSGLVKVARARGVTLRLRARVQRVEQEHGRVARVVLGDGEAIASEHVVIAAGAWAEALGRAAGSSLSLTPVRRHLVLLRGAEALGRTDPVVWRLEDEIYFRAESRGVLASPCDAEAWSAEVPPTDPNALDRLAQKLARVSPALASSRVQRSWACLRTFARDGELVCGPDPQVLGLHWLAGLGGRGMSVAPAAAEQVAKALLGHTLHPLAAKLSPARPELTQN